jgi:hypothetical protein
MMPKPKSFIDFPQSGAGRFTIQAQILLVHRTRPVHRPLKHGAGNSASRKLPANSQSMHECRFVLGNIRPEKRVLELKFYRSSRFKVRFGDVEKSVSDVGGDAFGS